MIAAPLLMFAVFGCLDVQGVTFKSNLFSMCLAKCQHAIAGVHSQIGTEISNFLPQQWLSHELMEYRW